MLRTKEHLSLIMAHHQALLLYLIHFKEEIREETQLNLPKESLKTYKITDKEIKMATSLIQEMTNPWDLQKYHNEYREALSEWLEQKINEEKHKRTLSKKDKKVKTSSKQDVVDFIALLKQSMQQPAKKVRRKS
jgi:DNA end-binding protein Ku